MKLKLKPKSKTIFFISLDEELWGILPAKSLVFLQASTFEELEIPEGKVPLILAEIEKYAWDRFLNFLALREHSLFECSTYLQNIPIHASFIEKFITKASELNFVNEVRFTEMYTEHLLDRGKSEFEIRNKLRAKGVEANLIDNIIFQLNTPQKKNTILEENIAKAIRKFSRYPHLEQEKKIINYLYRKGFSYFEVKAKLDKEHNDD